MSERVHVWVTDSQINIKRERETTTYSSVSLSLFRTYMHARRLTISLLHRHHVGGGTTLNDGVAHQVATLGHHSHQLRYTYTNT